MILVGPGLGLITSQYLQRVLGMSPLAPGLWTLPQTAAVIVGFLVSPALAPATAPAPSRQSGCSSARPGWRC
nr:hypothetical protein [Pseudonocardia nigra]